MQTTSPFTMCFAGMVNGIRPMVTLLDCVYEFVIHVVRVNAVPRSPAVAAICLFGLGHPSHRRFVRLRSLVKPTENISANLSMTSPYEDREVGLPSSFGAHASQLSHKSRLLRSSSELQGDERTTAP